MTKATTSQPAILEGQVLSISPTPKLNLATIEDCRREMARVYRDARSAKTDTADASRLIYILTSIAKMIELGQFEERIKKLEEVKNVNARTAYSQT
jgi:hypothetical protein